MDNSEQISAIQDAAGAEWLAYGPSSPADGDVQAEAQPLQLVQTFGEYQAEYAAIRKGVGLLDQPQRGVIEVTGSERSDFLQRFLTQHIERMTEGSVARSFLLNTKGRIDADMLVVHLADRTLLELDRFDAASIAEALEKFLFAEDVQIADVSERWRSFALHGPAAARLVEAVGGAGASSMEAEAAQAVQLGDAEAVVYRWDDAGVMGLHVLVPSDKAAAFYKTLIEQLGGLAPEVEGGVRREIHGRGIGWLAYNTARIEAGTAVYRVDFGPDSLPAETGKRTFEQAVCLTKGCYLGQEIVARMDARGHPKRVLVGLRLPDDRLPVAGSEVFAMKKGDADSDEPTPAQSSGDIIGGITSSTVSPMLGNIAVAYAVMKWGKHRPGNQVLVPAEGALVPAEASDLRFV